MPITHKDINIIRFLKISMDARYIYVILDYLNQVKKEKRKQSDSKKNIK